jgi:hypothetical protein
MPPTVRIDCTAIPHASAKAIKPMTNKPIDEILSKVNNLFLSTESILFMAKERAITLAFHRCKTQTNEMITAPLQAGTMYCDAIVVGATMTPLQQKIKRNSKKIDKDKNTK